jgi:peptidyl-prolyl cis-trans isomerase D
MADEAEAVAQSLRDGREMASVRLPLGMERGLVRDAFLEGAPQGTVAAVFEMEPDEIRVVGDQSAAWIVRLDKVTPADQDGPEAQALKAILAQQVAQGAAGDVLDAFTQALTAGKGIEINQAAVNAVHAQFP